MRITMRVVFIMLDVYYMAHLNKLNKSIKSKRMPFALFTNRPLAGAASLSFQYWDRECNCCFFFISTKFNVLIFNTEYAT